MATIFFTRITHRFHELHDTYSNSYKTYDEALRYAQSKIRKYTVKSAIVYEDAADLTDPHMMCTPVCTIGIVNDYVHKKEHRKYSNF